MLIELNSFFYVHHPQHTHTQRRAQTHVRRAVCAREGGWEWGVMKVDVWIFTYCFLIQKIAVSWFECLYRSVTINAVFAWSFIGCYLRTWMVPEIPWLHAALFSQLFAVPHFCNQSYRTSTTQGRQDSFGLISGASNVPAMGAIKMMGAWTTRECRQKIKGNQGLITKLSLGASSKAWRLRHFQHFALVLFFLSDHCHLSSKDAF